MQTFFFFLIGVELFYNAVLVSTIQQSDVEFPVLMQTFNIMRTSIPAS